ncbi:transcriptional regulator [Paraburkholderia kururiensis]|uniref:transcriptional regulator n=1 Tax=Paraburkholderia kururiensis TaxID=984307 RepID=UPI000348079D|nr:YdaS family helix-turn-helix protein [Paraburkholderia kururiensis]
MDLKTFIHSRRGAASELARRLGVSKSYVSQMANGKTPISPRRAVEIEEHFPEVTRKEMFPNDWARVWPELR